VPLVVGRGRAAPLDRGEGRAAGDRWPMGGDRGHARKPMGREDGLAGRAAVIACMPSVPIGMVWIVEGRDPAQGGVAYRDCVLHRRGWCSGPSAPIAVRRLAGRATTALGAVSVASGRPGSTGCGRSTNSVRARRRWPVRHSHVWCAASRWRRPARLAGFAPTPVGRRRTGRFDAVTLNA